MNRHAMKHLVDWKTSPIRKPLLLRGARQTGKSFLVGQFAREQFPCFVEINFEEHPEVPVEVKAGTSVTLKSLQLFLREMMLISREMILIF